MNAMLPDGTVIEYTPDQEALVLAIWEQRAAANRAFDDQLAAIHRRVIEEAGHKYPFDEQDAKEDGK